MCAVRCQLRERGTRAVLVEARAVEGLFAPAEEPGGPREILLRDIRAPLVPPSGRPRDVEDAELALLDDRGTVLGAYPLGAPRTAGRVNGRDLRLRCVFHRYPHPAAGAVWEAWARAFPPPARAWAAGGPGHRAAWLEAVRLHAATPRGRPAERTGGTYDLDGRALTDPPALYCALGEGLNGPAGYYGANLDALHDCLGGGFGPRPPFHLRWHHAAVARAHLGPRPTPGDPQRGFLDTVLTMLTDAGVTVTAR
ncbi:barstar family protein [Streptomyces triticirhizae]|uniref:barstar family protein n=1 Tax=Streptomyces triticirhizae TaxID=2483353 RepID=UPI0011C377AB|nr:barstar family protein [Streptomyces triticirhizae]